MLDFAQARVFRRSFERTKARKLKTMTADDVIAELHSLHFVDMAKSLASSVQGTLDLPDAGWPPLMYACCADYRTRKSKKRQRDASSEAGDATSALPAAPNASSPPAAKAARNASTATAAPKRTTNSTSADLAGMWGQKVAVADTTPAVAPGVLPAASPPTGSQSEDEDALASQEQLAELAAAFSVDET